MITCLKKKQKWTERPSKKIKKAKRFQLEWTPGSVHLSSIVTVRLPRQPPLRPARVQANLEPPPPRPGPSDPWDGNDDMAAERSEVRVSGWRRRLWSDRRWGWRTADSGGWAGGNTARWTSDGTEPDQPTPERDTDFSTSKLNWFYMKWSHVCCSYPEEHGISIQRFCSSDVLHSTLKTHE